MRPDRKAGSLKGFQDTEKKIVYIIGDDPQNVVKNVNDGMLDYVASSMRTAFSSVTQ